MVFQYDGISIHAKQSPPLHILYQDNMLFTVPGDDVFPKRSTPMSYWHLLRYYQKYCPELKDDITGYHPLQLIYLDVGCQGPIALDTWLDSIGDININSYDGPPSKEPYDRAANYARTASKREANAKANAKAKAEANAIKVQCKAFLAPYLELLLNETPIIQNANGTFSSDKFKELHLFHLLYNLGIYVRTYEEAFKSLTDTKKTSLWNIYSSS